MLPRLSENDCKKLLPLVRVRVKEGLFGKKADLLCVTNETVFTGRCLFGRDSFLLNPDASTIRNRMRRLKEIAFNEIVSVNVRPGGLRTRLATIQIQDGKRSVQARVPQSEIEHLVAILHQRLGDRIKVHKRVPIHGWGISFLILLFLSLAVFISSIGVGQWESGIAICAAMFPLIVIQIHDHIPARFPWNIPEPKKPIGGRDLSGRKPIRSRVIGWGLKIVSAVALLYMWLGGFGWLLALPFLLLIHLGHLLASVPPKFVQESDKRAPILYLRSFFDDRKTTLMPESRYAVFMGVQPPRYLPSPWRYILMFNPVRILRILFGIGVDTSEEQLALFFRKRGPFVAIGRPGETFATPGASRMYVTNDEWQDVVLEYLEKSQVVLLQPAQTEGVRWEVEKTLAQVEPQKVLLCMVNFHGKQNDYEKFRLRAEEFLKHPLPANVAYTQTPAFIYFDQQWNSYVQEVSCRSPILWPLIGEPVDLQYTLQPFLNSAAGSGASMQQADDAIANDQQRLEPIALKPANQTLPRPPRGISAREQFSGGLLYLMALLFVGFFVGMAGEARKAAQQANQNTSDSAAASNPLADSMPRDDQERNKKILNSTPTDSAGWKQRGKLHVDRNDVEAAVSDFTDAIKLDATDAETFLFRGDANRMLQKMDDAIEDYRVAVKLDSKLAVAWNNLGYSLDQTANPKDAIESYSRAIELVPNNPRYLNNRGLSYLDINEPDMAIADFSSSLKLDGSQSEVYFFHGKALAEKAEWVEAIKYFNTALNLDSNLIDALSARANAFYAIGDSKTADFNPYEFALRDINELLDRNPDNERLLLDRATINEADGKLDDSIADLDRFLLQQPKNVAALQKRCRVYHLLGKFEKSIADTDVLLQLNPDDTETRLSRAGSLFSLKRYDEIIAEMNRVLTSQPDTIDALQIRGNAFYFLGRFDEALQSHTRVLELQPKNRTSRTMRAQVFANRGQYELAASEYQQLVDGQPDLFDPRLFHAFALFQQGEFDEFLFQRGVLSKSFADESSAGVKLLLIRLHLLFSDKVVDSEWAKADKVQWQKRITSMKELVESTRQAPGVVLALGAVQIEAELFDDAIETLESIQLAGEDPITEVGVKIWLSIARFHLEDEEGALDSLQAARDWVVENCPLTVDEGQPLPENGQWWQRAEIHSWLSRAESLMPD